MRRGSKKHSLRISLYFSKMAELKEGDAEQLHQEDVDIKGSKTTTVYILVKTKDNINLYTIQYTSSILIMR